MTGRIGILAGSGRLPLMIAESASALGGKVHIVGIIGEADPGIARFPHTWVSLGQIGLMVATLRREGGDQLVIAGGVRRPDFLHIRPDAGFFASLPQVIALVAAGGDDSVLTRVVRFFERKGLQVRGAHEVAPDLLATTGPIGRAALTEQECTDARIGFAVRHLLAPLDAGQSVVVSGARVLAVEGAEGTDRMLERVLGLRDREDRSARWGVLAKGPKPGQEMRIDMPAIGPMTVDSVVAAGLAGIALETGGVLILDRSETLRRADANGCAIQGLPAEIPPPLIGTGTTSRRSQLIGRIRPGRQVIGDAERGIALVERLAAFATGRAAVVARAHVLAIEGAEGTAAMLARVRSLRQWSDRRSRRRIGTLVCRASDDGPDDLQSVLEQAALQGLAAIAVVGRGAALESAEGAARRADDLGLCLLTCETAVAEQVSVEP